jgi:hypothetical protein
MHCYLYVPYTPVIDCHMLQKPRETCFNPSQASSLNRVSLGPCRHPLLYCAWLAIAPYTGGEASTSTW